MGQIQLFITPIQTRYFILRCLVVAFLAIDTTWLNANPKQTKNSQPSRNDWPIPNEPQQLFYLQRDPDINTIIYQLNIENGHIDADNPINIFWIRYAEDQERKPLNYIQRTMAFGMTHRTLENGDFALQLVSYKTLPLRLSFNAETKKHVVYTRIQGKQAILDRIYVRINGGSTFNPNIEYFELTGRHVSSGRAVSERIVP